MARLAILYICIGSYSVFWEGFYKSFEEKFLLHSQKEYFVFTDEPVIFGEKENKRIHRIYQEDLGWPGNTLFRYKMFVKIIPELRSYDYIFFMNANIICASEIKEKEFLPEEKEFLVVQHPGYYNRFPYEFPYERRKTSSAYISYLKGDVYICGGVNGGKAKDFIELIEVLAKKIETEFSKGIIARWHDESHINRYIIDNDNYRLLTPSYCYPEGGNIPFEPKLIVLDKKKWLALDKEKAKVQEGSLGGLKQIKIRIRNKFFKILYSLKGEKWKKER